MENQELFKCHVCDKEFDQYGLELHFITNHNLEEEEDIKKSSLVHDENIKNKCELCGKSFSRKSHLDRHMKSVHEGIKEHM